jgi:hypothetical protein
MNPKGIIGYHTAARSMFKALLKTTPNRKTSNENH